jgi:hypothetical protein
MDKTARGATRINRLHGVREMRSKCGRENKEMGENPGAAQNP